MSADGLAGRAAVVTGAGSGIGEACATLLAELGAAVLVVDRDGDSALRVRDAIVADGGTAERFVGDLTDPAVCDAMVGRAVEVFGGLGVAVNNAGISGSVLRLHEYAFDEYRAVMSVNADAIFACLRAELAHMVRAGGGAIVNMSSMFGVSARDCYAPYIASKHAVLGLTRAAAIDYAADGIRVNAVGPGVIHTPLLDCYLDAELAGQLAAMHPAGRLGTPREVANLVAFLCSDAASFITGGFHPVDGAFTAGVVTGVGTRD